LRELDRADAAIVGFLDAIETSLEEVAALDGERRSEKKKHVPRRSFILPFAVSRRRTGRIAFVGSTDLNRPDLLVARVSIPSRCYANPSKHESVRLDGSELTHYCYHGATDPSRVPRIWGHQPLFL